MNATGGAGAFLPGGIGWYRRVFEIAGGDAKRRVFVEFDGVMANSEVWVNGVHLGKRPYGYSSFRYELTDHLNVGKGTINRLAVRVDNSAQPASRWYSGAGIYRHVRLVITDAVHIDHWGTFVTTPRVSSKFATVHLRSTVVNQSTQRAMPLYELSCMARTVGWYVRADEIDKRGCWWRRRYRRRSGK